jgi:DNA-binding transcriptional LysR family regulator
MEMELARLRHILAVARTGSFSRAAEEESITQPALSRSIAAFEQRHGVVLFDRGRGGARPTPAGALVIEQAGKLLSASRELERSLQLYGRGEAGRVAIGLGPLLASMFLPELGSTLLKARPGLQIVTMTRSPDLLVPELLNDRIEMIFGNNWSLGQVPGTERERLGTLRIAVVGRGGHPLAGADRVTLSDLADYPVASAVEMPSGAFGGHGGAFVCENFHVLREAVLATDCFWMSSPAFLAEELRDGRMAQLHVADLPPGSNELSLITRRGRTCSPAALAVAEAVRGMVRRVEGI